MTSEVDYSKLGIDREKPNSIEQIAFRFHNFIPDHVSWSPVDRPPSIRLNEPPGDLTIAAGQPDIGYTMVLGTHGVKEGSFYYEIKKLNSNGHIRVGISTRLGDIYAYPGYDSESFGMRDKDGVIFSSSKGFVYGKSFDKGDVIGILVRISKNRPAHSKSIKHLRTPLYQHTREQRTLSFETLEHWKGDPNIAVYPVSEKMDLQQYWSELIFFKNGECQNLAFGNFPIKRDNLWFPAVGIYRDAVIQANFGPDFEYPPIINGKSIEYLPFSSLYNPKENKLKQQPKMEVMM
eukprot:TRINITY_DN2387_c0_g1_i1.p1 TRINITY_DN2387_c0_g1~~TRINITY_DN2387_c0_g1_i1.p1  ORF type:complete len:291 (-),score=78.51 TRINITY_DN2387_c0_g1_i1:1-873(-)